MAEYNSLVSVVVVSYNSADTICETLDSVLNQTYTNWELIVSDDCSKDNTVNVTNDWLERHGDYRDRVTILTAEKNQGVCANFNKAIRAAKGEWIKIIAADDILLPNCCQDYVEFAVKHPLDRFFTSYQNVYINTFEEKNCCKKKIAAKNLSLFEMTAMEQLVLMAYKPFVNAPTMFFAKSLFDDVNGFDEKYEYEDHPFYINILELGNPIRFVPSITVGYRIHESSFNTNERLFNYKFTRASRRFRIERCFKYYNWRQKIALRTYYSLQTIIEHLNLNKRTKFSACIYKYVIGGLWKFGEL